MGKACCFTGHRPGKLPDSTDDFRALKDAIEQVIFGLIEQGYTDFYTGMAQGIDLFCGEILAQLCPANPGLRLIAVLPFAGQGRGLLGRERQVFDRVMAAACQRVVISPEYTISCMQERNKYMVDRSDCVLAVFGGAKGGTKNTIDYARRRGKRLLILHPDSLSLSETEPRQQLLLDEL